VSCQTGFVSIYPKQKPKEVLNNPKQKICFGSFGINRNWNVSVLWVFSVQPKRTARTEGREKGMRREGKGGWEMEGKVGWEMEGKWKGNGRGK
jgi:hypothetical protein